MAVRFQPRTVPEVDNGYVEFIMSREAEYDEDSHGMARYDGWYRVGKGEHGIGCYAAHHMLPGEVVMVVEPSDALPHYLCGASPDARRSMNSFRSGVYPAASVLNHSCLPNCFVSVTPNRHLCIRVLREVPPGTELTICYLETKCGVAPLPVSERRAWLEHKYDFTCMCPLCVEEAEDDGPQSVPPEPTTPAEALQAMKWCEAQLSRTHSLSAVVFNQVREATYGWLQDPDVESAPLVARLLDVSCQKLQIYHTAHGFPKHYEMAALTLDRAGAAEVLGRDTRKLLEATLEVLSLHETRRCHRCGVWKYRTWRCQDCCVDACSEECCVPHPCLPPNSLSSGEEALGRRPDPEYFFNVADPPWFITAPQQAVVDRSHLFHGRVLEVGCGYGYNARYLSSVAGVDLVVAFDMVPEVIEQAKAVAPDAGPAPLYLVGNALEALQDSEIGERGPYDVILDSAVMHCFSADERRKYLSNLREVARPDTTLVVLCFDITYPIPLDQPPFRFSQKDLRDIFQGESGWSLRELTACTYKHSASAEPLETPAPKKAWCVVADAVSAP